MKIGPIISMRIKAATRGRIQIYTVVVIQANVVNTVILFYGSRVKLKIIALTRSLKVH